MLDFKSHKIQFYGSIVLLWIVAILLILRYFNVRGLSPSSSLKTVSLEKVRGIPEGSLQKVSGKLLIGPYRDLWSQWYTFFAQPNHFQFWLYNFTLEDGQRLLREWASNGTQVQGIIESAQYAQDGSQFDKLVDGFADSSSIQIVADKRLNVQYQHAKTFLSQDSFIIQTANMTNSSFRKNREIFFLSQDTGVLASLHTLFANDWAGISTKSDILHPNLIVCPLNCRQRIESLLRYAKKSIIMYQQYIADNEIQDILRTKKQEGLDIQIILGDMKDSAPSRDQEFIDAFTGLIHMQANPYVHAKAILIDGQFLLIGSMNMSDTSLDKNREIGILLLDENQIALFRKIFMKDWNGGIRYTQ